MAFRLFRAGLMADNGGRHHGTIAPMALMPRRRQSVAPGDDGHALSGCMRSRELGCVWIAGSAAGLATALVTVVRSIKHIGSRRNWFNQTVWYKQRPGN